jgi:two-component system, NtrC family, sensor histidine kinase HydH
MMTSVPSAWRRYVRPQDFVWLILFSALAVFSPDSSTVVILLLIALGAAQVLEPRMSAIASIALRLVLCYLLIYFTQGIASQLYVFLLLPVITAATSFGLLGTALVTLLACAEYSSFLVYIDWGPQFIDSENWIALALRLLTVPLVGFLTHQLAEGKRVESRKYQMAAEQLAAANKSLKEAEAQVRRSERLAALGQLTAGLAHELRNPMGTMKTSAELLARNVGEENAIAKEMAGYVSSEVDRVNTIITRFLDFARPQHLRLAPGDLDALLDTTIERFEREKSGATATISVYKNYAPDIPKIEFDNGLMERVFSNLLINAAQASPPGGVVTVKTRRADPMVEVSVIDRGSGIDPKNLESIFNPFFTTKSEGVGLGLAICSKIVDEHGGKIAVESTPGEGSVFRVFLPLPAS